MREREKRLTPISDFLKRISDFLKSSERNRREIYCCIATDFVCKNARLGKGYVG